MSDSQISITLDNKTFSALKKKKDSMGFSNKEWSEWFKKVFDINKATRSPNEIIEDSLQRVNYEKYYDMWIRNFAINLENIWQEPSAAEISISNKSGSAIVIGRGPSIDKHEHLNLLAKSNYDGTIICTDGALVKTLKAGVTPDKFQNFFVVTVDSNEFIKVHYDDPVVNKYGRKIKGIFSTTTSPEAYLRARKAGIRPYWLHTLFDYDKGKTSFNYISGMMVRSKKDGKGLPAIQTGGNVGTSCWIIGWSILRRSPVTLIGMDQGYHVETPWEEISKYHKFPTGVDENSKAFKMAYPVIYNPKFKTYCKQDPIFQYYCNALKEFILRAPNWVKTINATEGGALFGDRIKCTKFSSFLREYSGK